MMKKGLKTTTTGSFLFSEIKIIVVLIALLPVSVMPAAGQSSAWELPEYKESIRAFSLGAGTTGVRETYISSLSYRGPSITLMSDRWRNVSPDGTLGYSRSHVSVLLGRLLNTPGSGRLLDLTFDGYYSRAWNAVHTQSSDLLIGPSAMFRISGLYNMSGSNNPANGEGYLSVGVCADYTWRFRVCNCPFALQAGLFSPLAGLGLGPEYDQSYWHVYRYAEYTSLIRFAWIGNNFSANGQVALVCPAKHGRFRLGVNMDYLVNRLGKQLTRMNDTSFTVGYVRTFTIKDWKL